MKILYIVPNVDGLRKFFESGNLIDEGMPSMFNPLKRLISGGHEIAIIVYPHYNEFAKEINLKKENLTILSLHPCKENIFLKLIRRLTLGYINIFPLIEIINFTYQILKKIKNINFKIIYAHDNCGILLGSLISNILGKPLIARIYGWSYMRRSGGKINLINKIKYWDKYLPIKIKSDLCIITKDGSVSLKELEQINYVNKNIKLLYNGYDNNFISKKLLKKKSQKTLISISGLSGWKNVDIVIKIFHLINIREPGWKLYIIGDGSDESKLKNLVSKLGLSDKVIFTGRIKKDEVFKYLKKSDFFINLYDRQTLSNTLWEAMQMGKCVITRNDSPQINEVIENNLNGYLFFLDDLESIAKSVIRISKDQQKLLIIGENAQKTIKDLLPTWGERVDKEINMIKHVYAQNV